MQTLNPLAAEDCLGLPDTRATSEKLLCLLCGLTVSRESVTEGQNFRMLRPRAGC